jgi:hypothetical protein
MKNLCRWISVFAIPLAAPTFAADLNQLQSSFIARYDEANTTRDEQLRQLETSYLGALDRHLGQVKASGELDRVVPVRDEIEAIKAGTDPLPAVSEAAGPELKTMRGKYVTARANVRKSHAGTLVSLSDKMTAALQEMERSLTRDGKIDEALSAKRMRETLATDSGILAARELLRESAGDDPGVLVSKWTLLLEQGMQVEEKGFGEVGSLTEVAKEGRGFWSRLLTGGDDKDADRILVTPSPSRVSFKPQMSVKELRGKVSMAFPNGRATVRIKAGGKQVFEQRLDADSSSARIDLVIDPTRSIEIETEGEGRGPAWIYWEDFESR